MHAPVNQCVALSFGHQTVFLLPRTDWAIWTPSTDMQLRDTHGYFPLGECAPIEELRVCYTFPAVMSGARSQSHESHGDFLIFLISFCFIFNSFYFYFICALLSCLYACLCGSSRSPGTGVIDSCEVPCGCWELNPDPLEEQPVLQNLELSLQPLLLFSFRTIFFLYVKSQQSLQSDYKHPLH